MWYKPAVSSPNLAGDSLRPGDATTGSRSLEFHQLRSSRDHCKIVYYGAGWAQDDESSVHLPENRRAAEGQDDLSATETERTLFLISCR